MNGKNTRILMPPKPAASMKSNENAGLVPAGVCIRERAGDATRHLDAAAEILDRIEQLVLDGGASDPREEVGPACNLEDQVRGIYHRAKAICDRLAAFEQPHCLPETNRKRRDVGEAAMLSRLARRINELAARTP